MNEDEQQAALWQMLEDLQDVAGESPALALARFATLPRHAASLAEFQLLYADLLRCTGDVRAATRVLEQLLDSDPDDADAQYLLADILGERGELARATRHFLETLRIDSAASTRRSAEEMDRLLDETLEHLKHTIEELPELWRERLAGVPLLVQHLPSQDMVRTGLDPRALGLFEGPMLVDSEGLEGAPMLTRIVLFAENLALEFPDAEDFREQVRITVLHELGHYFGLDEDDMLRLGLD